mgnify:CR=1 FL=1
MGSVIQLKKQINNSYSKKKGTLRGLHLQLPPMEQGKLVYCVKGSIYDVAVDVRISSQTFGKWVGYEINSRENKAIWIPPGFAHGFQTLEDDTEIIYLTTGEYSQKLERSIAWNDEEINIEWPISNLIIRKKNFGTLFA